VQGSRRIVVVGLGRVGSGAVALVPPHWTIAVVDVDEARVRTVAPDRSIDRVTGDASSRLVLAKCGLGADCTLVVATGDDAVNAEVVRLARAEHGVQDIVAVRSHGEQAIDADVVDRAEIVIAALRRRVGGLSGAGDGSGRGELLQVPVLAGSPVIGHRLRDLSPRGWLVAMVYRGEALVVPHGDTVIEEGDRVLLSGEPTELEPVATFFRGGLPTFPAAWGTRIGYADRAAEAAAQWLAGRTTASSVVDLPPGLLDPGVTGPEALAERLREDDVGCLVVAPRPVPWSARVGLSSSRWAAHLHAAAVPVLVARGNGAPERVLVALNADHDARAIAGSGIDLARQAGVPLALLTVAPPAVSPDADVSSDEVRDAIKYARLHGLEPTRLVERGNPIERIRASATKGDLLVVGHAPGPRNSVFTPDVSLFLLHDTPGSVLFVPWKRAG